MCQKGSDIRNGIPPNTFIIITNPSCLGEQRAELATSEKKFRPIDISFPYVVSRLARLAKTKHFTIFRDYICLFFESYPSLKCYFSISSSFLYADFLMATYSALMGK